MADNSKGKKLPCPVAGEQEITLAATAIALSVTRGKTLRQVETLVNLFSLTTDLLQAILTQRSINRRADVELVDLDINI